MSSSRTSMPTGHQVMQRPQPTQPDVPNWSHQVAELVGQPLAVAVLDARPEVAAGDLREAEREAAVPGPLGRSTRSPSRSEAWVDAGAEAGRADERAVGAGEAALGDLRPARAVGGGDAAVPGSPAVGTGSPIRLARPRRRPRGGIDALVVGRRRQVEPSASSRRRPREPARTTKPSSSSVSARSKPLGHLGPGAHRGAEAGARRRRALDGDDERGRAGARVVAVDGRARRRGRGPGSRSAAISQARTPRKASGADVRSAVLEGDPAVGPAADRRSGRRGGNVQRFQDVGPTA